MSRLESIIGLFETHLGVADVSRSVVFYVDVVGLSVAAEVPERAAALLWTGAPGSGMLGLWSIGSAPISTRLHVAFRTSVADVVGACDRLRSLGVTPLTFSGAEADEPDVIAWIPAIAVYFRDPDGHLLEFVAMLDDAPRPECGVIPLSKWALLRRRPA
jgi:lactoylglutathione lyase